jgi:hypothetical protein
VNALIHAKKPVTYAEIESDFGHDAFLIKNDRYADIFSSYMKNIVIDDDNINKEKNVHKKIEGTTCG